MAKLIKEYWTINPEEIGPTDWLYPLNIKVNEVKSYPDCTYYENITFTFEKCDKNGARIITNNKFIVNLEIETGYRPKETVSMELYNFLNKYDIFNLSDLITAFNYRQYYEKI